MSINCIRNPSDFSHLRCENVHCLDDADLPSEVRQNCNDTLECWNNAKGYCDVNKSECGEWSEVHGISYYEKSTEQRLKICKSGNLAWPKPGWITLMKIGIRKILYNCFLT